MAEHKRRSFAQVWLDWKNDVLEHKLSWHLWALLSYLQCRANPWTGIVTANARQLCDELEAPSERLVQDCLSRLRALCYLWYPGELSGLRHYQIFLDGFERKGTSVLRVYSLQGQLIGEAASYLKKMRAAAAPVSLPSKRTVSPAVPPTGTVEATPGDTVKGEKSPDPGRSTEGSTNGTGQGKGLSLPGFCPTEGGNLRTVPVGDDVGVRRDAYRSSDPQNVLDPPVSPTGGPPPTPPPPVSHPGGTINLDDEVHQAALSLVEGLKTALSNQTWRWPSKADLAIGRELVVQHGLERVQVAILHALSRPRFLKWVHSFKRLRDQWNDIEADREVDARESSRERRRNNRAHQEAVASAADYYVAGDVDELARGGRGRKNGGDPGVGAGDSGGVPGMDPGKPPS